MDYSKKGVQEKLKNASSTSERLKNKGIVTLLKLFILVVLFVGTTAAASGIGVVQGIIANAPELDPEDVVPDGYMTTVYDVKGNQIEKLVRSGSNRTSVLKYDDLPEDLVNAFVAIEDSRFWTHNGIDLMGILRAGSVALTQGVSEGGSTITQQLLKNNVFINWMDEDSLGSSIERKLQEQYLAMELEKQMSKELIMLNYLNTINLGSNTLGVRAASERYFNKDISDLTLSECAVLAAITKNPSKYNPILHPEDNAERREKVLKDMYDQGYISQEERSQALADPVYDRIAMVNDSMNTTNSVYSYFVDELIEQVIADLQTARGYTESQAANLLYSGGLKIYTTLDPDIQAIIDEEVNNESYYPEECTQYACTCTVTVTKPDGTTENFNENDVKRYFRNEKAQSAFRLICDTKEQLDLLLGEYVSYLEETEGGEAEITEIDYTLQPQVSFVIMDQATGQVKGICGGRGEKIYNRALNRATNTTRQPGSLFKVLADYTPALDIQGDTLATVFYDSPYSVNEKSFSNYWGTEYTGYSSIRQSIVYSMNIVAVRCLMETVGPSLAYEYLLNYGFTTLVDNRVEENGTVTSDINPSICLGGLTDGVSNLEVTAAYAAIANGGVYTKPVFYTKILDKDGNILVDNTPETRTVMKESTAFLLTSAMEEAMDGGYYPKTTPSSSISGTGKAADVQGMSIAGKTGTTTSTYDMWFAGFSPYYTAVIWTGYDENKTILLSQSYHKKIWSAIMTRVHEGLPDIGFTPPAGIETRTICRKSGKLAVQGVCDLDPRGSMVYEEYFAKGTAPTDYCDTHAAANICLESGQLAGSYCPEAQTQKQVYMVLPADDTGNTDDSLYRLPTESCTIHTGLPSILLPPME